MKIEEALKIIGDTNFYSCFANEKQDEAFDMAVCALMIFRDHKRDIKMLERMKGDHIAQVTANVFRREIEIIEGSADNGK